MNYLNTIFSYYDNLIANFSPATQAIISLVLLFVLIGQIYLIIKNGEWIFIVALIVLLPGTWPAAKSVGNLLLIIIKFLIIRAQLII